MTKDEQELREGILDMVLEGVREYTEGYPVELRHDAITGRMMLRAYNEGRYRYTQIDLCDVLEWLSSGPADGRLPGGGFRVGG